MDHYLEQAIDRVVHLIRTEEDRKVVFLTGSGVSLPAVPSSLDIVKIFLEELGPSAAHVQRSINSMTGAESYQHVAHELRQRRGERGLAAAIRKAVMRAIREERRDFISELDDISSKDWTLPPAQRLLGELVGRIPRQQLGAILTTNFDALTEVALEVRGIKYTTLATPANQPISIDSIFGSLPVIHLHGFWRSSATLSTSLHLNTERPNIERMIKTILDKSTLIVLGYGGWNDSFMRALVRMVGEGHMAALDSEVVWLQYGPESSIASHPILPEMQGQAGVGFYFNIDAPKFLDGVLQQLDDLSGMARMTFPGWEVPPSAASHPAKEELKAYYMGAHPTWSVAHAMPTLVNARTLQELLQQVIPKNRDEMVLIASPTGEGKTTALLQAALKIASENPSLNVLYRRPAAPLISCEWLDFLREKFPLTVIFVDDADLIMEEINDSIKEATTVGGRIVWVLATHTSYARRGYATRLVQSFPSQILDFQSIGDGDAEDLAAVWTKSQLVPRGQENATSAEIASLMKQEWTSLRTEPTLFGSVLGLWKGEGLRDRVAELVQKLGRMKVSGVSYRYLFSAVAITQHAWQAIDSSEGLSLTSLGRLANVQSEDVIQLVVNPLGREVGLSRVGDKVFLRHPAIAEAAVDIAKSDGDLPTIAKDIARHGSTMRFSGDYSSPEYSSAYKLSRCLEGAAAIEAGQGAIDGARGQLEPRVTYIATLRQVGHLDDARKYAAEVFDHLSEYDDRARASRGFYVERSVVEAEFGNLDLAIDLAVESISDRLSAPLRAKQLQYGLTCLRSYARRLSLGGRPAADSLRAATELALNRLPEHIRDRRFSADVRMSTFEIIDAFRRAVKEFNGADKVPLTRMAEILEPESWAQLEDRQRRS